MTSRELIAAAAIAVPACTTVVLALVPARFVPALSRAAAVPTAALAVALTALALSDARRPDQG